MTTASPSHLVVLCCHGIWLGGLSRGHDESDWLIADFQHGETPTFIEHIKAAIRLLETDGEALLVISGGPTRKETRLSEAESYRNVALANDLFTITPGSRSSVESRIILDERALDSYHNILFSLTAFWQHTRTWPARMTVVSHGFKRERIVDGHCAAIGFPLSRVTYLGINPPGMMASADGAVSKSDAMAGERRAVDEWQRDPHGQGDSLTGKRMRRNVWSISQALFETELEGERVRSGLVTTQSENGDEVLVEDVIRPWAT
ncbi:DUF218 domain-containing protein [Plectosphaerella plurivora]|uniref:DUF218 domain-containing protein n=1 Tax=Plectosphaerella plurivora TaxID=936078 RepID=A0A9P8VK29_9PEZI|nr:DUF218 domain-containing protein [Plectosphaerella plurivora]